MLLFNRRPGKLSSITTMKVNWDLGNWNKMELVYFGTSVSIIFINAVVCCCCWSISKDCMWCICFCCSCCCFIICLNMSLCWFCDSTICSCSCFLNSNSWIVEPRSQYSLELSVYPHKKQDLWCCLGYPPLFATKHFAERISSLH